MASLIVGIGEFRVSNDATDVLVTHALGSCIGVVVRDPLAGVAGLLHYMLPESRLDAERAVTMPCLFADSGIALLLERVFRLGAAKSRLIVVAAGGAQMLDDASAFNIGLRNSAAMRTIFNQAGIPIRAAEIGGTKSRTVRVDVGSGRVRLWTPGHAERDMLVEGGSPCLG